MDLPREILSCIFDYVGECAAVCKFVSREWHSAAKISKPNYAAFTGSLTLFKWALENLDCSRKTVDRLDYETGMRRRILSQTIVGVFDGTVTNFCRHKNSVCESAALAGQYDVLRHAAGLGFSLDCTAEIAAAAGRVDMIRLACWHKSPPDQEICEIAARHGHLDIIKFAFKRASVRGIDNWVKIFDAAAAADHMDILRYLYGNCPNLLQETCAITAAENSQLCLLEWIAAKKPDFMFSACMFAIHCQVETVKFILSIWSPGERLALLREEAALNRPELLDFL